MAKALMTSSPQGTTKARYGPEPNYEMRVRKLSADRTAVSAQVAPAAALRVRYLPFDIVPVGPREAGANRTASHPE